MAGPRSLQRRAGQSTTGAGRSCCPEDKGKERQTARYPQLSTRQSKYSDVRTELSTHGVALLDKTGDESGFNIHLGLIPQIFSLKGKLEGMAIFIQVLSLKKKKSVGRWSNDTVKVTTEAIKVRMV